MHVVTSRRLMKCLWLAHYKIYSTYSFCFHWGFVRRNVVTFDRL